MFVMHRTRRRILGISNFILGLGYVVVPDARKSRYEPLWLWLALPMPLPLPLALALALPLASTCVNVNVNDNDEVILIKEL